MKHLLKQALWIIPFLAFCLGYLIMASLFKPQQVTAPTLIGKSLSEALVIAAPYNINLRSLEQKESEELAEGTILSQIPRPGAPIKSNQCVYVVTSKKSAPSEIPDFHQKKSAEITAWAEKHKVTVKQYYLPHEHMPYDHCFAQCPPAGTQNTHKPLTIYCAHNTQKPVIIPNLQGKNVSDVQQFLSLHGITTHLIHTHAPEPGHQCVSCIVRDQRPLPGSLVILSQEKPLQVQLQVG